MLNMNKKIDISPSSSSESETEPATSSKMTGKYSFRSSTNNARAQSQMVATLLGGNLPPSLKKEISDQHNSRNKVALDVLNIQRELKQKRRKTRTVVKNENQKNRQRRLNKRVQVHARCPCCKCDVPKSVALRTIKKRPSQGFGFRTPQLNENSFHEDSSDSDDVLTTSDDEIETGMEKSDGSQFENSVSESIFNNTDSEVNSNVDLDESSAGAPPEISQSEKSVKPNESNHTVGENENTDSSSPAALETPACEANGKLLDEENKDAIEASDAGNVDGEGAQANEQLLSLEIETENTPDVSCFFFNIYNDK